MANLITEGMQMPVANKRAAQQVEAANQIALQQSLKGAGAAAPVNAGDIQGLAAQQAGQAAQLGAAQQAAEAGRVAQTAQRDMQTQQISQDEQNVTNQLAQDKARTDSEAQLASLGRDIQENILDKNLALDERTGQLKFTNERQLADTIAAIARDEDDLNQKLQEMQQASEIRVQATSFAADSYAQAIEFASKDRILSADQDLMKDLNARRKKAEEDARKAKKNAAATGNIIGAAKVVAGAAIVYSSWATGGTTTAMGAGMMVDGASGIAGSK
jgi:hypothetical protein